MEKDKGLPQEKNQDTASPASPPEKKEWEEPKLAFVEPKLTQHGDLEKVTGGRKNGFFGPFSP
jgi:hypothetical protein